MGVDNTEGHRLLDLGVDFRNSFRNYILEHSTLTEDILRDLHRMKQNDAIKIIAKNVTGNQLLVSSVWRAVQLYAMMSKLMFYGMNCRTLAPKKHYTVSRRRKNKSIVGLVVDTDKPMLLIIDDTANNVINIMCHYTGAPGYALDIVVPAGTFKASDIAVHYNTRCAQCRHCGIDNDGYVRDITEECDNLPVEKAVACAMHFLNMRDLHDNSINEIIDSADSGYYILEIPNKVALEVAFSKSGKLENESVALSGNFLSYKSGNYEYYLYAPSLQNFYNL